MNWLNVCVLPLTTIFFTTGYSVASIPYKHFHHQQANERCHLYETTSLLSSVIDSTTPVRSASPSISCRTIPFHLPSASAAPQARSGGKKKEGTKLSLGKQERCDELIF